MSNWSTELMLMATCMGLLPSQGLWSQNDMNILDQMTGLNLNCYFRWKFPNASLFSLSKTLCIYYCFRQIETGQMCYLEKQCCRKQMYANYASSVHFKIIFKLINFFKVTCWHFLIISVTSIHWPQIGLFFSNGRPKRQK